MAGFYEEKKSLTTMSKEQHEAAMVFDNPVLIVAGAGSGKTRTLIGRATKLLLPKEHEGLGADPGSLMMVTFTNKAGREMRERFGGVLDALRENGVFGEPWIGTFHSISMRILRIEARHAGYGANFTILDDSDAREVAKDAAMELGLEVFDIDEFFSNLEYAKARLLTPEMILRKKAEIEKAMEAKQELTPLQQRWSKAIHTHMSADFPALYKGYQDILSKNNSVDFSDLINQVTILFRNRPDIRDSWRSTFRHFMIDETQDMNPAQAAWLAELTGRGVETVLDADTEMGLSFDDATAGKHAINRHRLKAFPKPTIAFVGDDDQAIYAFRGSDAGIMLGMGRSYEGMEVKYLRESYRCQPNILSAANRLIVRNSQRFDKEVIAADPGRKGVSVVVKQFNSYQHEFASLALELKEHIKSGGKPSDFGILLRTRNGVKDVAKYLREQGLPVTEGKASNIRESMEFKDVMAYAGFLVNPDAEVLMRRIINKPARQLGPTSIGKIGTNAKLKNIPFVDELRSVMNNRVEIPEGGEKYPEAFKRAAQQFGHIIVSMRKKIASQNAQDALMTVLKDSGYMKMLVEEVMMATDLNKSPHAPRLKTLAPREFMQEVLKLSGDTASAEAGMEDMADAAGRMSTGMRRMANIALLLDQAEGSPTLEAFIQDSMLEMSENKDAPGVNVMTMHASKGLEFDHVRLPLWYQGMMPMGTEPDEIEEERRLAYVSLTRARHTSIISYPSETTGARFAMGKGGKVKESAFIEEMTGRGPDVVHFNAWGKRVGQNRTVPPLVGTDISRAVAKPVWNAGGRSAPAKDVKDFKWKGAETKPEPEAPADLFSAAAPAPAKKTEEQPASLFDDNVPF